MTDSLSSRLDALVGLVSKSRSHEIDLELRQEIVEELLSLLEASRAVEAQVSDALAKGAVLFYSVPEGR